MSGRRVAGLALMLLALVVLLNLTGVALAAPRRTGTGIFDLPYQDLLVGWVIAAAIGAVGGVVYVGIVGPARRSADKDKHS
jgi:hypothetical protein